MKDIYTCPHCLAAINAKRNIILAGNKENESSNKGLILLHEELGNYAVALSASLTIETGDKIDFYCPVCHSSLQAKKAKEMAEFLQIDEMGTQHSIFIMRTYGERCTFKIDDQKKVKSFGERVKKYQDPEWFL